MLRSSLWVFTLVTLSLFVASTPTDEKLKEGWVLEVSLKSCDAPGE